ncbi:MAG: hypothetical protein RJA81_2009, partial [Planctomycetota bacterium]
ELTNTIWTSHDINNSPYTTVGNYGGTSPVVTWTPLDAALISPFNGNIVTLNWSTVNFTNNSGDFSIVDTGTSNAVLAGIPSSTPPGVATFSFSFATPVNNPYIFMRVNGSSYSSLMQMVFDDGASNNYNLHMIGWSSNFSMSSQDVVSTSGSVNDGFIAQVLGTNISTIRLTTQNSNSLVQWQFSVAVPEPSTYVMMFGSVLVLGLTGFRKRKAGKFALNS